MPPIWCCCTGTRVPRPCKLRMPTAAQRSRHVQQRPQTCLQPGGDHREHDEGTDLSSWVLGHTQPPAETLRDQPWQHGVQLLSPGLADCTAPASGPILLLLAQATPNPEFPYPWSLKSQSPPIPGAGALTLEGLCNCRGVWPRQQSPALTRRMGMAAGAKTRRTTLRPGTGGPWPKLLPGLP